MALTVPIYVYTIGRVDAFDPGSGAPTVDADGTYITDEPTLETIVSAAARAGVQLRFSATGTNPSMPGQAPFVRYDVAQALTSTQKVTARTNIGASTGGGGGQVNSVVAGTNVTVDATDPANPVVSSSGGGGGAITADSITDATVTGKAVLRAATTTAARTAIGAGTSSFDGAYGTLTGKPTLGTAAAANTGDFDGAGAASAVAASVSNVTNTSDANKPVSTAQQTALDAKVSFDKTYPGDPGVTALGAIHLAVGAITSSWHNLREVYDGSALASWFNEWGALRGSAHSNSKFDALVRAIGRTDYGAATHQGAGYAAFETISSDRTQQHWGRNWTDGALFREAIKHNDLLLWKTGDPDPTTDTTGKYGFGSTGFTQSISPTTFVILVMNSAATALPGWAPFGRTFRINLGA